MVFRHPNYYKNLRKLARNRDSHVRPISGSADFAEAVAKSGISSHASLESDQAISKEQPDGVHTSVRPGPGLKRQASSRKPQASSGKPQAPSLEKQASSPEEQASSLKP